MLSVQCNPSWVIVWKQMVTDRKIGDIRPAHNCQMIFFFFDPQSVSQPFDLFKEYKIYLYLIVHLNSV